MVKRSREDADSLSCAPDIAPSPAPAASTIPLSDLSDTDTSDTSNNTISPPPSKYTITADAPPSCPPGPIMQCHLPPHRTPLSFPSYTAYETHYAQAHLNRCSECHRNFPSEHFLSLHIAENHDPLNEVRRARGEKTYSCFLPTCDRVCSSPAKRRLHLIDKHLFPRNYEFRVVNDGIDKRNSLLRCAKIHNQRRRSSAATRSYYQREHAAKLAGQELAQSADGIDAANGRRRDALAATAGVTTKAPPMPDEVARTSETEEDEDEGSASDSDSDSEATSPPQTPQRTSQPRKISASPKSPLSLSSSKKQNYVSRHEGNGDATMQDITTSMSALNFVPPSVRFGRRGGGRNAGFGRR
ncbi:MAG: hypothetical protein M1819_007123 [Sarea resinae]|nr:MAG: hypothetical protein M1819_007123 [Sarea resinae]